MVCQNINRKSQALSRSSITVINLCNLFIICPHLRPRQILFLNKIDLFAEKLPHSPLGDYFPDYSGGDNYDLACEYLLHRFVSLNQNAATKQIYAHYTCATDTQQIKCKSFEGTVSKVVVFPDRIDFSALSRLECYSRYSPSTSPP